MFDQGTNGSSGISGRVAGRLERSASGGGRRTTVRALIMSSAIGAVLGVPAHAQVGVPLPPTPSPPGVPLPPVTPPPGVPLQPVTPPPGVPLPPVVPPVMPPAPAPNSLPTVVDVVRNPGNTVTVTGGGAVDLNVAIRAPRAIIDWARFDVPAGQAANFRDATGGSPDRGVAVLNRVVGRPGSAIDPSDIFGAINSDRNVSVFLLNPTGILFGANSAINTGSFVASTLALSDEDFNADRFNFTQSPIAGALGAAGSPPAQIVMRSGARMDARSGPLVLVSEQLDVAGTLTSARDVVMVAASDVSMNLTPGGPVSVTINQGTRVRGPLRVRGQVTGQNVYLATATRSGINDALLDVGGVVTATTAVATDRGIVLVAGGGSGTFGGVTVAANATTAGRVALRTEGSMTATGPGGGIGMRASGDLETTATLAAATALVAQSSGAVRIAGNASADTISVDGGSILLGIGGASRTLTGRTRASYTTRDGALVAAGDLSLIAGGGTRGVGDLVLDATGGNIALLSSRIVAGGTVGVRLGTRGSALQLGNVTADRLTGVGAGGQPFLATLNVDGNVDVGDLALVRTLDLSSTGRLRTGIVAISAGDLRLAGATGLTAVELNPSGNLVVSSRSGGIRIGGARAGGDAAIDAAGAIDARFIGGTNVRVNAGGVLDFGTIDARGTLSAVGTEVLGTALRSGSTLNVVSRAGDVAFDTGIAGGDASVEASGDARIASLSSTGGNVGLTAGADAQVAFAGAGGDVTLAARTLTLGRAVAERGSVSAATSGNLQVASAAAGRDVRLTASRGTLAVTGDVAAGGVLAFEGRSVSLGGASPARQAAAGSVTVRATNGDIVGAAGLTLAADTDATGGEPLILDAPRGTVRFGQASLAGGGSAVAVRIAAGQPLVLGNVSGTNLLSLGDAGALGPLFTSGPITLGTVTTVQTLRVATSRGDIVADSIRVTGQGQGASLAASGQNGAIRIGSLTAPGAVALAATDIDFTNLTGGSFALDATRNLRGSTVVADGAIRVAGADVALGDVTSRGGGLDARGGVGGLTIGTVAVRDNAALTTTQGGSIETRSLTAGSAVINSAAALRIGSALTTGDLQATAATTITGIDGARAALTAGGALAVNAGGAALLGDVRGGSVAIRGASLDVGAVDAAREASLVSGGTLTLARAATGGTLRIAGTGAVALPGALTVGGDLLVSGGTVDLGGTGPVLQSAAGRVDVTATNGGIAGRTGLTLRSNADGQGSEALVLDATGGDIAFATGTTLLGGPARQSVVAVRLGTPGSSVTLDRVDAARFASVDAGRTGFSSVIDGSFRIAALNTTGSFELAVRGPLALGTVVVTDGNVNVQATGDGAAIDAGSLTASGSVTASTSGAFTASSANGGAGVSITGGSVTLGTANAGTTLAISAMRGDAVLGTTTTGGNTAVSATRDVTFAGLTSGGDIDVRAGGAIGGGRVTATGTAAIQGAGTVRLSDIAAGAIRVTGGATTIATARTPGVLALTSSGDLTLGSGEAASAAVRAAGTVALTGTLSTTGDLDIAAGTDLAAGTLRSGGAGTLTAGRDITGGTLTAAGPARVTAAGTVRMAQVDARAIQVDGGTVVLDRARSDTTLALNSRGDLTLGNGQAAGGATLRAGGNATIVDTLAAGEVSLVATGDVAAASVASRGNLALTGLSVRGGSATAAGTTTVEASGAVRFDRLAAGRGATVRGGAIGIGNADVGEALALTSGGALALGGGRVGGIATLDGVGTATLGGLQAAGIVLRAADAEINGTLAAATIRIVNRDASAAGLIGLGDTASTSPGFRLSNAEFGRLNADVLTVDAGAGRVNVGTLDIGADAGRRSFDLLSTGTIDVGGLVSAGGSGRNIRIGGGEASDSMASSIRVVATPNGGGMLLVGDNALELRGARIGVGQAAGFLDPLDAAIASGISARDAASALVGNSSSALYNAAFGGRAYAAGTTLLSARTLTLNFTDYALVQNTAVSGQTSGIVLGGTAAAPVARALTVNGGSGNQTGNALAVFGTINGIGSNAAALLGRDVIDISGVDRGNSRVNGCAVASVGGGCLTNVLVQPVLALFDVEGTRLFAIADALVVPFETTIGSSNEALLSGGAFQADQSGAKVDEPRAGQIDDEEKDVDDAPAANPVAPSEPAVPQVPGGAL